ncbi:MAG: hypothetical protein DMF91_07460 [Acidobacteria bacterium]|jgi:hypothetical protein|nr:MAG: hypothetical protein DMF91_07460 [Acidobacteriota bacterium]
MLAVELLLAFEYTPLAVGGIVIAIILAMGLLVPYLIKEIRRGKVELGPRTPTGAGDTHPGRRGDPAPGQPEAQADPYTRRAQR